MQIVDNGVAKGHFAIFVSDNARGESLSALLFNTPFHIIKDHQTALTLHTYRKAIVLLDLRIPNCLNLIQKMKEEQPLADIIVFDNRYDSDTYLQAKAFGVTTFFELPISKPDLRALVKRVEEASDDIRTFINLAYKQFLNSPDEHLMFIKELIQHRKETGSYVNATELSALYFQEHLLIDNEKIAKDYAQPRTYPTILIVEDEPSFRNWVKSVLRKITPNVIEAESAAEALEKLKTITDLDVAILDIELPGGKSGVELHPEINRLFPHSQTIMLTAYSNLDYVESSFSEFVFDYLVKTKSDQTQLLEKLTGALQKKAFQSVMPTIGNDIMDKSLTLSAKLMILSDIAKRRMSQHKHLKMRDIYLLFPELQQSTIPETRIIPNHIVNDGVGIFIDMVKYAMKNNEDWKQIFDDWDGYLNR